MILFGQFHDPSVMSDANGMGPDFRGEPQGLLSDDEALIDATQGIGKPFQDAFQAGDHLRKLVQRTAAVELSRVMGNGLDAKHAFAFGTDQSQLAAVQPEDRQIIRRSLNRDFAFGRALCSPAIFRTMPSTLRLLDGCVEDARKRHSPGHHLFGEIPPEITTNIAGR